MLTALLLCLAVIQFALVDLDELVLERRLRPIQTLSRIEIRWKC